MAAVLSMTAMALLCGCGQRQASAGGGSLPPGVMSAARACEQVIDGRWHRRFFTGVEQVHLVLTTYAKGEPVESRGDISSGMPPRTLVWVVEVHAKTVKIGYFSGPAVSSAPSSHHTPAPLTDYSVVMNARTAQATDSGACSCWPLPLWKVGTVVSLPPQC